MSAPDIIVVGAGIVGGACALELARGGAKVAVYDRGIVAGGASAAGMGHVCVMDDSEAQFQLTRYSLELWAEMSPQMPAAAEHVYCGTLWVAADEEEMAEARRKAEFYLPRGTPAELLDAQQLAEAEPNLRPGLAGGLLLPADSVLYQPFVAAWTLGEAKKLGATVHTNQPVAAIEDDGLHMADGSVVAAGRVVNATGAWAGQLTRNTPVKPKKGHLMITERAEDFIHHEVIELGYIKSAHSGATEAVAFNVAPRPGGQVLIGSCRQLGVWDAAIDRKILNKMLRRAMEYMPGLAGLRGIRTWTGFRAATEDSLPLIGPCEGYERVWLATGHEGLGITTATATAKVLAAQMLGRECEIPVEPYLPARKVVGHD